MLYACTVILYVYRLRQYGFRLGRLALSQRPGLRGEFVFQPSAHEYWGRRPMLAKLLELGTAKDLLPHLENARVVRVRRGLLVAGMEVLSMASKSKGERYRQSWVCTQESIRPEEWPAPPRRSTGFDAADDDDDAA